MASGESSAAEASVKCSLKSCERKDDLKVQDRVEVKTYSPPAQTRDLKVNWTAEGYANFHLECWKELTSDTPAAGSVPAVEAKMIEEAAKTAEYFESPDNIDQKAKHIAQLLQSAKHAIAFTGKLLYAMTWYVYYTFHGWWFL